MALYKRGRWNISPEELDQDVLDLQHDEIAAWLESIAGALSAGDSEVAALDQSLEKTDNVVLAAATIHAIYGIEEGFSLSAALRSFGTSRLFLVDLIELGLASGKLDVVLRQAASKIRAESQETTTLPAESPISCVEKGRVPLCSHPIQNIDSHIVTRHSKGELPKAAVGRAWRRVRNQSFASSCNPLIGVFYRVPSRPLFKAAILHDRTPPQFPLRGTNGLGAFLEKIKTFCQSPTRIDKAYR